MWSYTFVFVLTDAALVAASRKKYPDNVTNTQCQHKYSELFIRVCVCFRSFQDVFFRFFFLLQHYLQSFSHQTGDFVFE